MMNRKVLSILCWLIAFQTIAVNSAQAEENITCSSPGVLNLLANTIKSSNGLSNDLNFDFNEVVTKKRLIKAGVVNLECEAKLNLVRQETNKVEDSLNVEYTLGNTRRGGNYTLSFKPVR
jgi:hypothetical protein